MKTSTFILLILFLSEFVSGQTDSSFHKSDGKIIVNGFTRLTLVKGIQEQEEDCYIVKIQGTKQIELRKSNYELSGQKTLADYLGDNSGLAEKIRSGLMKFEDLDKIVTEYNAWRRSIDRMTNEVGDQ